MNILVVGFGNMGCRHTQALLSVPEIQIWVVEPNEDTFTTNMARIGGNYEVVKRVNDINNIPSLIEFCVIATSAQPRFEIMKTLIESGIKKFLIEKVAFQSDQQFYEIINLLHQNEAQGWCNFVNRYFPNYKEIKSRVHLNSKLKMTVTGGDFGLGCNALHYVDLFEYLSSSKSSLISSNLYENKIEHRRGNTYREVYGACVWESVNGDQLIINSDIDRNQEIEVLIEQEESTDLLNQSTLKHFSFNGHKKIQIQKFVLLYTSSLTHIIFEDIMDDKSLLPTIEDTFNCHSQFFKAVNEALGIATDKLCPIT